MGLTGLEHEHGRLVVEDSSRCLNASQSVLNDKSIAESWMMMLIIVVVDTKRRLDPAAPFFQFLSPLLCLYLLDLFWIGIPQTSQGLAGEKEKG